MATAALIPVSEYLKNSEYEPDAEYIDGRIEERPMGEHDHSSLQRKLLLLLSDLRMESVFMCYPERRVQVAAERFRVPDLVLLRTETPVERIIVTPPLLCIEILSPEDGMSRTLVKIRDYQSMGVREVWVVDGERRTVLVCRGDQMTEHTVGALPLAGTSFKVEISQIFSALS